MKQSNWNRTIGPLPDFSPIRI